MPKLAGKVVWRNVREFAVKKDPDIGQKYAEFEDFYGEQLQKLYEKRKAAERKAEKKYHDFVITY